MNRLEILSHSNKENYQKYLKRMTDSIRYSTKEILPILAKGGNNILDVGCGSGILLSEIEKYNKDAILTGIDLNRDAIKELKKTKNNWNLLHKDYFELKNKKYDTIIFSSILHEISSYNDDPELRFTEKPIEKALIKTNELLEDKGNVIIRDGMLCSEEDRNNKIIISFVNPEDGKWLYRFQKDFRGFDKLDIDTSIEELENNKYLVKEGFLKEFLCTYTWGEDSYPREINERFGILTRKEWLNLLDKTGFEVETIIESKEEYKKYLTPKVIMTYENGKPYVYPYITITVEAHKK